MDFNFKKFDIKNLCYKGETFANARHTSYAAKCVNYGQSIKIMTHG